VRVLVAGGTGLVGKAALIAAARQNIHTITVGRRPSGHGAEEIVADFDALPSLPQADVALCVLGTTIKRAGSKAAFKAVDYSAVMAFAAAAQQSGVNHFIVVTAVGSNPDSSVFYSSVKGAVERDLEAMGFTRLDIVQPGLLLGPRTEKRPVEELLQKASPVMDIFMRGPWKRYGSVKAEELGEVLIMLTQQQAPGVFRHTKADWTRHH